MKFFYLPKVKFFCLERVLWVLGEWIGAWAGGLGVGQERVKKVCIGSGKAII